MTTSTTIELPRLENERAERYEARVSYILMGADRSLEAVRQKTGKKPASLRNLERWSSEDRWVELAAQHDQTVYTLAANDASDAYRADLVDYRKRYGDMGKSLFTAAGQMVNQINARLRRGDMELGPGALTLAVNAAKVAADLEALALRVEGLLNEPRSE